MNLWSTIFVELRPKNFSAIRRIRISVKKFSVGRGGGQVVSVLAFYSKDPSLYPAEAYSFFCNIVFEKNENKQKRGRGWPTFKKLLHLKIMTARPLYSLCIPLRTLHLVSSTLHMVYMAQRKTLSRPF